MASEKKNGDTNDEKETSEIYVRFIDILFAVVIGQSFGILVSQEGYKSWLSQPVENTFGIATFLLVYVLVITSWIGYHRSIKFYPIKSPLRFVVDIFLLFIYYVGFVNANNFEIIMAQVFPLSFLLYTVWDGIRLWEYRAQKNLMLDLLKRFYISLAFTILFFIISEVYMRSIKGIAWVHGALFTVILALLIIYRYLKWYRLKK